MQKTMNWKGFIVIVSLVLIVFLTLLIIVKNKRSNQTAEINEKQIIQAEKEELYRDLLRQQELVGTEGYIVQSAIRNYSYVNRDDIRFEFSNPEALNNYSEAEFQILREEWAD